MFFLLTGLFHFCSSINSDVSLIRELTDFALSSEYLRGHVLPAEQHAASDLPSLLNAHANIKTLTEPPGETHVPYISTANM